MSFDQIPMDVLKNVLAPMMSVPTGFTRVVRVVKEYKFYHGLHTFSLLCRRTAIASSNAPTIDHMFNSWAVLTWQSTIENAQKDIVLKHPRYGLMAYIALMRYECSECDKFSVELINPMFAEYLKNYERVLYNYDYDAVYPLWENLPYLLYLGANGSNTWIERWKYLLSLYDRKPLLALLIPISGGDDHWRNYANYQYNTPIEITKDEHDWMESINKVFRNRQLSL